MSWPWIRPNVGQPTPQFIATVQQALQLARERAPDDAVRYMAESLPVYAQRVPDRSQAEAGGCPNCVYLGLWADRWPGLTESPHGHVWVFEDGIRLMGGDLLQQVYETLIHEFGHALQRDHVLEAMEQQGVRARYERERQELRALTANGHLIGRTLSSGGRGCGCH